MIFVFTLGVTLAEPNGADPVSVVGSSERGAATSPQSEVAVAGNVTELTIYGISNTQTWQGYYGNVSGSITLSDASGNPMYNWSLASPKGEVFASENDSVDWTGIECFDWASDGAALEAAKNIDGAEDGIDETFAPWATNQHAVFSVGVTTFNATTQCMSTDVFDSTGASVDGTFEEVLLGDGTGNAIFAALLEEDVVGFNSVSHDFQMLVLEDGHNGDTATTDYYFYVELE